MQGKEAGITEYQRQLFQVLHDKKVKDWETFSDREYVGVWKSVIEKYPETAHFIYELIQNADDARASAVEIILYKDKLVFKHNGTKQFSLTDAREKEGEMGDINSITSVACSTKINEEQTIGKFGVGFKATFQYTDSPYIFDDTFWFRINNFIIPILLDSDHELRNPGETLFEIPFKNKEKAFVEILERLNSLDMPVTFLPNVKTISWRLEEDSDWNVYSKKIIESYEINEIQCRKIEVFNCSYKQEFYLFTRKCETSKGDYDICVGYRINSQGELDVKAKSRIYCFFPTGEKYDGCFICHAPFLLTDNRDAIKSYEPINKIFLQTISRLAADALVCLRDIGKNKNVTIINENIFYLFDIDKEQERNSYLYDCYKRAVKNEDLILTKDLGYRKIGYVATSTLEIEKVFSCFQLTELLHSVYDFIQIKTNRTQIVEIAKSIGAFYLHNDNIVSLLRSSFMSSQDEKWIDSFLNYITVHAVSLWKITKEERFEYSWFSVQHDNWKNLSLLFAPIVKTTKGEWIAPYTLGTTDKANVILPLMQDVEVESDVFGPEIDHALYAKHKDLYDNIRLKSPDEVDYVEKVILRQKGGDDIERKKFDYIFKTLASANTESKNKLLGIIKTKWYLKGYTEGKKTLFLPDQFYVPNEDLVFFMKDANKIPFVDTSFYCTEENQLEVKDVNAFFVEYLNASIVPLVVSNTVECSYYNKGQFGLEYISLSQKYDPYKVDFFIDGYNIANKSKEWSFLLWQYLCRMKLDKYIESNVHYVEYHCSKWQKISSESTWLKQLKEDWWICIDAEGKVFSPPHMISEDIFYFVSYERNPSLTKLLDFGKDDAETALRKQLEEENKRREEEEKKAKEIEQKNQEIKSLAEKAESLGINVADILRREIESYNSNTSDYSFDSDETNSLSQNNLDAFNNIARAIGEENLSDLAENINEIYGNWLDLINPQPTSKVRRTINYIGCSIYEHYLRNNNIEYETAYENGDDEYDFKLLQDNKYITVETTEKSISDGNIPIGLKAAQNILMRKNPGSQFRVIRISIKDMNLHGSYQRIINLFGKEIEPCDDDRLKEECEKIAKNYWISSTKDKFDEVSPEYAIRIERKNGKK